MFTGIIEETGSIIAIGNSSLKIGANRILEDVHIGDSIAVNGTCLTVTAFDAKSITVDVMNETFGRTALGQLTIGAKVNLERAMAANGRFGGHIVSGHIDGTGSIVDFKNDGIAVWISIAADSDILKYVIMKGSITIDGVSLTVAYVDDKIFKVSIIPHTAKETTLLGKKVGDVVNLENDVIAKYVEKLLGFKAPDEQKSNIDIDFLTRCGF
jgi:riboflavin synthase